MSCPVVDLVCNLLETPFVKWNNEDKHDLLSTDSQPRPDFLINATPNSEAIQNIWYLQYDWLCGSYYKRRLFCWPCLLFGIEKNVWNYTGFEDFSQVEKYLRLHHVSEHHIQCVTYFKKINITSDDPEKILDLHTSDHNRTVRLNRNIIRLAIDSLLYLNRMNASGYKENFVNFHKMFVMLISNSTPEIQIQYSKIRSILTIERMKTAHLEIMDCIAEHLHHHIQEEIIAADFLGLQIDDITDIRQASECAITVRYVRESGQLVEWFHGIQTTVPHMSAKDIMNVVEEAMEGTDYESKLVSFAHDGLTVREEHIETIQHELKNKAPNVLVNISHSLSTLLLQRCFSKLGACRMFFTTVQRIPEFFKRVPSKDYLKILPVVHFLRFELDPGSEWWYHSQLLSAIVDCWDELKSAFQNSLIDPETNDTIIHESKCFISEMNDFGFAFLCVAFKKIFEITDKLYYHIRCKSYDNYFCRNEVETQLKVLESLKSNENFMYIFESASSKAGFWKKYHCPNVDDVTSEFKTLLDEIIISILSELTIKFNDLEKLSFFCLSDSTKFQSYTVRFPDEEVCKILQLYPSYFNQSQRLKKELEIFFSDAHFWNISPYEIPQLIREKNLHLTVFSETYKMFLTVLTNHFSIALGTSNKNLQGLKTYRQSHIPMDNFHSLTCMTLNADLLNHLIKTKNFYEEIIDKFYCYTQNDKELCLIFTP
ncbi:uncharacterized protein [Halyomorpha halys]|uniref:uncharacterized protein n=1 Tax=Halyomorpha halys TaxID=286706 RepID=UPI0034D1D013